MRRGGIVPRVLLAVAREPLPHLLLRVDPRLPLAVDEEVVLRHRRQPPAAAYSAAPASASAACAAAKRASGTRYGEQLT